VNFVRRMQLINALNVKSIFVWSTLEVPKLEQGFMVKTGVKRLHRKLSKMLIRLVDLLPNSYVYNVLLNQTRHKNPEKLNIQ